MCIKKFVCLASIAFASAFVFSQEALKSMEDEYFDFQVLQGRLKRPTLSYRTLSDNRYIPAGDEDSDSSGYGDMWADNNLGRRFVLREGTEDENESFFMRGLSRNIEFKAYGVEWFNSINHKIPYGYNDGALWQGRGYNTSLTGGVRFEGYGFEATLKPQICYSQNVAFDIRKGAGMSSVSSGLSEYAYFWSPSAVDLPQRFGDSPFFTFDFGDSEIRWSWYNFTVGFGTQAIWLGPAWFNPALHSNNAASYPKVDIGVRKQEITLPKVGSIGWIEARLWTGWLSESGYFDSDPSNDHNFIHGLSFSYSPKPVEGLTFTLNRVCLVKAKPENLGYIIPSFDNAGNTYVYDEKGNLTVVADDEVGDNQLYSVSVDWLFPKVGFEAYGEYAIDDFSNFKIDVTHTAIYMVGAKKIVPLNKDKNVMGELIFEWSNTEMSQDYQLAYPYSFGHHHFIKQGYTNKGEWIGPGCGYGGQSQYLGFNVYYPKGNTMLFMHRWQPDNNYVYSQAVSYVASDVSSYLWTQETRWSGGISGHYFMTENFMLKYEMIVSYIIKNRIETSSNIHVEFGMKYNF